VQDIKAGRIQQKKIGGEIILKIDRGMNITNVKGKEKFAFNIEMPRYDNSGRLL
jgi:hypothetical protein